MIDLKKTKNDDAERKRQKRKEKEQQGLLTVEDYIQLVEKDPHIAQNAYARGYEIVCGPNGELVEKVPEEEQWLGVDKYYPFFRRELFGVDRPIAEFMELIEAGKNRASTGKQLPLLVGPPGSGKSTLARLFKQGFENYNLRPVYFIAGCPQFDEPLRVLPRHLRKEFEEKLDVRIEGDLCPVCRHKLEEFTDKDGVIRWWDIPVEPLSFSMQAVRGISSFEPSDEKTADVTTLTGRERMDITARHGFSHYLAYEISGKIPRSNRGVCEPRELTSGVREVLQLFFSVAEEREIEVQGSSFPHLSVDTTFVAHTNLTPFKKFAANKEYEGLHNRFHVIPFPYPLRIKDELAVYKKLIERESDFVKFKKCHIAPGSLELAALFAVMTRYISKPIKGISALTKAKLYNGEQVLTELEKPDELPNVGELLEEGQHPSLDLAKREGMFGVSSRDVLAALNTEIVNQMSGKKCLTPLSTIRALREIFTEGHRIGYSPEDIKKFTDFLSAEEQDSVITEHQRYQVFKVCQAFLKAHDDQARTLYDKYVKEVEYWKSLKGYKFMRPDRPVIHKDPGTGKPRELNIQLMRGVEKHMGVTSDEEAEVHRSEVLIFKDQSYDSYSPLSTAVQKKLLEDSGPMLALILSEDKPLDTETQNRKSNLPKVMQHEHGFCEVCSAEAIEQARAVLDK